MVSEVLGRRYGVSKLPYGVLIDKKGSISGLGIVNSREHLESLIEAHVMGKPTIQDYLLGQEENTDRHGKAHHPKDKLVGIEEAL